MSLWERMKDYRQSLEHKHGWKVELECPECGFHGVPEYCGWTPIYTMSLGKTPTIYAILRCPVCGRDLKPEAASKLVELFSDVGIPRANRRALAGFLLFTAGMVIVAILLSVFCGGLWWITPLILLTPLGILIPIFNKRIASMRTVCACGSPDYIFMGMLARTYCFRCSNCGRLLRLRD
jgi:hypothetical protein